VSILAASLANRVAIVGIYSSSDELRRLRRHQLPPTDPPLSPDDSVDESLGERSDELPDEEGAGAGSGSGALSGAGSGVESLDVESVDLLALFDELSELFEEDLREIGRRRRVVRAGLSSAASSDFTSAWSLTFSAVVDEDLEDDVDVGLRRRVVVERVDFFSVSPSSESDLVAAVRRPRVHSPVKWVFLSSIALSATRLASGERLLSNATTSVCLPRSFAACIAG